MSGGDTHTVRVGDRAQVRVECDACRVSYMAWVGGGMILGCCPACHAFGFHLVANPGQTPSRGAAALGSRRSATVNVSLPEPHLPGR